ncbi:alpha-N-acetylglucosamine transferase [Rhodopseudomonas julia]|uniref:Alpha-N-acetylglucosamine transferase n=1 Tax=Rhodopseudomonas julia TaxID=200617 RepID=A0ABU0C0Z5_9BRAD|nr:glycosyltransferase [Rhodopseudomonas julia]MDQ0324193.1 alpha-N-acetylglucosamine transferase [Rhodopseudomonas julia]
MAKVAYATLAANPDYLIGATALARSFRMTESEAPLLVLAPEDLPGLDQMEAEGVRVVPTRPPDVSEAFRERHSRAAQHRKAPFTRGEKPSFHDPLLNFAKLRLWELDEYERIVFVDADALFLRNCDKLFGYPGFSAAPNVYDALDGFHRLNSGVFVTEPDKATYETMMLVLDAPDAFWPRTDQSFLQDYFADWHGLPYIYNVLQYVYFRLPQLWNWDATKILHYQYEKPWQEDHPKRAELGPLIDLWWNVMEGRGLPESLDPIVPVT